MKKTPSGTATTSMNEAYHLIYTIKSASEIFRTGSLPKDLLEQSESLKKKYHKITNLLFTSFIILVKNL